VDGTFATTLTKPQIAVSSDVTAATVIVDGGSYRRIFAYLSITSEQKQTTDLWRRDNFDRGSLPMETKSLRIIDGSSTRSLVAAPPPIALGPNGTEYVCGYCGILLLIAEPSELQDGIILRKNCGRYNEQG
jgi:hypothetical protein